MNAPQAIALIAVTRRGTEHACTLRQRLRRGDIFRPAAYGPARHNWECTFDGPLAGAVGAWFKNFDQLVFFVAAGAVTRLLAPHLVSKKTDPGVLAVDEAGRFVIPILSGHRGGANAFARTVAGCLGATPVITTASDVMGGLSLDLLEDAFGWRAEPRERLKEFALALVNKEPLAVVQEIGTRGTWLAEMDMPENVTVVGDPSELADKSFTKVIWVTENLYDPLSPCTRGERAGVRGGSTPHEELKLLQSTYAPSPLPLSPEYGGEGNKALPPQEDKSEAEPRGQRVPRQSLGTRDVLWFRPKSLVLGVGCERGLSLAALEQGLEVFLQQHGYAHACIGTLASATVKVDEPALIELARREDWQTAFCTPEELAKVPGIVTPSTVVEQCVGSPGVAEPAALLAAGTDRLLVAKQVVRVADSPRAMTFALARLHQFHLSAGQVGKVYFIGAGPGDAELLTCKAQRLLRRAEVVIYAGSLIPETLLRQVPASAQLHNSAHLTLEQVMTIMLQAVRGGRTVLRLQSGDTSIYSSIQEQIALLEKERVEFEVVPGISSFQALAAALKSEFTLPEKVQTIILTRGEGNTPMPEKEALADLARHQATLCIFLSARLAADVQSQLLMAYPADTPVAIAYRITWPDEQIFLTHLDKLAEEMTRHDFQRTTLIAVGTAIGGRHRRSQLYDDKHGHIFRKRGAAKKDITP
jgi:precorrin-4 C11-methyltransferase